MNFDSLNPFELYEHYSVPSIFSPLSDLLIGLVTPHLGEHVMDLACGTGILARKIAPLVGNVGRIVAVDINSEMLMVARKQPQPQGAVIEWIESDAATLDIPNEQFDLILCQQGLQFFSQQEIVLSRTKNFLRQGGRLVLAVWQDIEQQPIFSEFAKMEAQHLEPLGVSYNELVAPFSLGNAKRIEKLLDAAGFIKTSIVSRSVNVQFPSPETFVRNMEMAYGAIIPEFIRDPNKFAVYLDNIEAQAKDLVQRYTRDNTVCFKMPTYFAISTNC
ncbi:MAG: class I SAM-dependent methyltransferase [Bacteroidales bacterium]|jgi:ubiquinone/menaquinone biosynthesis C-methylase UbiE|nr:class I SAM-dependent methyltransferase [Bacteroidales bacterium]